MSVVKGIGIGLAVGTMAAVASSKMMTSSGRRACKKSAARCMKNVENVISGISTMMG